MEDPVNKKYMLQCYFHGAGWEHPNSSLQAKVGREEKNIPLDLDKKPSVELFKVVGESE